MSLRERFEAKVSPEPTSGCHLWTGGMIPNGYGMFWHGKNNVQAHRMAWELANGTIQDGMVIDHLCHNRACVNVAHLRVTTPRGNSSNYAGKEDGKFSSKHVGVAWSKRDCRWKAYIYVNRRLIHLGYFDDEGDAVTAREVALRQVLQSAAPNADGRAYTGVS